MENIMDIIDIVKNYEYDVLIEEIRNKIKYCWNDCINFSDVVEWLSNFQGKVFDENHEKILALLLLNNYIYLSHEEVLHLCRVVFYEYIHTIALEGNNYDDGLDKTTYYPIGNPSESSSLVMYFFRLANDIAKDKFNYYPSIADKDNRVVFIDDISGSGKQASDYISEFLNKNNVNKEYISYMTLIGTEDAAKVFEHIEINFKSACLLDERMKLFSGDSYTKFTINERSVLLDFINGYKNEVDWNPLGYGSSELALGFYYNVPDNCLPIFWRENSNWRAIFKRFHKKYYSNKEGEVFNDRDRFI